MLEEAISRPILSPETMAWRRFRRHRLALFGIGMLCFLIFLALFAPWLAPHNPNAIDLPNSFSPPTSLHLLGADENGRDTLSRLLYAAQVSMSVGLVAVSIYLTIGILLGLVAGYYGGLIDSVLMRFTDAVLSFPTFMIILAFVAAIGPSIFNVMIAIGVLGWPGTCRLVRGQVLSVRQQDFILAASATGIPDRRIMLRHILPNVIAPVIVVATFGIGGAILTEAGLSFLGLGVQPPTASWGNMLSEAQTLRVLEGMPWLWLPPGITIALAVLSINFIGDGLRDALDPHTLVK
ncbi:MAG: ABC transporter permease [Chloroflexi bacterium]|nr:ABC transporter permease [Chloroflexota bacterium]